MCICKLYDISPSLVEEQGFIDSLHDMISDENSAVVANAVAALCEIQDNSPREVMKITTSMLQKLTVALTECSEWGQVYILDALARYEPRDEREAEAVIERIQARMQHSNTAVVLSAIKVIMVYMEHITRQDSIRAMVRKMGPPLVTLLSNEHPEIQYVSLRNINLIVQKRPDVLQTEIRVFFCKYNDPIYVKKEKMDIMVKLATERNIEQVLTEFKGYAQEVDVEVIRKAVRSIGRLAIRLEKVSERCVKALLQLIQEKTNYVVQEAIIVIRDIFRRYPNKYESIIGTLCQNLDTLDEPEAKSAMIWIIGEYADRIDNSDELLETFLDGFDDEPPNVQLSLLTATVKLFLQRPGDTKELVKDILNTVTQNCDNPDIRDRGYIYWRLLSMDPDTASEIVLAEHPVISDTAEGIESSLLDLLIANLSTLAVVYQKNPDQFVKKAEIHEERENEDEDDDDDDDDSDDDDDDDSDDDDDDDDTPAVSNSSNSTTVGQPSAGPAALDYAIKRGDTLGAIARKYGCTVAELVAANSNLIKNPNRIHIGWKLKIPQHRTTGTTAAPTDNNNSDAYIIKPGDTLWAIARRYGCTIADIIKWNKKLITVPDRIRVGWQLKIPVK